MPLRRRSALSKSPKLTINLDQESSQVSMTYAMTFLFALNIVALFDPFL
jgi:hypothetical protein